MKEYRSASQILFGFLPEQTVDLQGGVWKVSFWRNPKNISGLDDATLRRELLRTATPWANTGTDGGFVERLRQGYRVRVLSLDRDNGVQVSPFPKTWMCKRCQRLHYEASTVCQCGYTGRKGQLPFVGYHDACGCLKSPWIPPCPEHRQVKVVFPGTASASEIRFVCPVEGCGRLLRKGFGFVPCDCGRKGKDGKVTLAFNVHRSSQVYTPRTVVLVNPPSLRHIQQITSAGGPPRALSWVANGMKGRTLDDTPTTMLALRETLLGQGVPLETVEVMVVAANAAGGIGNSEREVSLPGERKEEAEDQAVTIALAVSESRARIEDLVCASEASSELGALYREAYPRALSDSGLCAVELLERFPVLTGSFGYTRGDAAPGNSRLVPFLHKPTGDFVVYADVADTEALFVRLDPVLVVRWLRARGHDIGSCEGPVEARWRILQVAAMPEIYADDRLADAGTDLLKLVHSYAHRFIRIAAVFAGIDRNALSELLVPVHCGFFVYALARGDFVLGGLQAVFESELDGLLRAMVEEEFRCPLDPGCLRAGGACVACLHLGEPSCRFFNRFLDRGTLYGKSGYLQLTREDRGSG